MIKKNTNNRTLELVDLQKMILTICSSLNRPIRKSQLIKMVTELFECNTPKQIEFALLDLIEQAKLIEEKHFIVSPEFSKQWDKMITAADEGIVKFLLILKEEAKHDIFFDVYAPERLSPSIFFKYVRAKYPALLERNTTALTYMEQIETISPCGLTSDFYMEMNDYPTNRWFTSFFDNPDCRVFIHRIEVHKKYIILRLMLLPGRKRSYAEAHKQFEEFEAHIGTYFNKKRNIHCKSTLLTMRTGNGRRKRT